MWIPKNINYIGIYRLSQDASVGASLWTPKTPRNPAAGRLTAFSLPGSPGHLGLGGCGTEASGDGISANEPRSELQAAAHGCITIIYDRMIRKPWNCATGQKPNKRANTTPRSI